MRPLLRVSIVCGFVLIGCSDDPVDPDPPEVPEPPGAPPALMRHCDGELCLALIAENFTMPLQVVSPPGDHRVFVVEQRGRAIVLDETEQRTYIDISADVLMRYENGLLGMAFHPAFASNGRFYLHYTDAGADNIVEEFIVDPAADVAQSPVRRVLLRVVHEDTTNNHKAGHLAFGPDGYLWISVGDGMVPSMARRTTDLRGSILRIDVDAGQPYGVPADNPFVGDGTSMPEIYYYGLRNPWRFSIDAQSGLAFIADVGTNQYEEINVVPYDESGHHFGWPIREGPDCAFSETCESDGLTPPSAYFSHSDVPRVCALIGGAVYRGDAVPALRDRYVFADACAGLRTAAFDAAGEISDLSEWMFAEVPGVGAMDIVSVGQGGDGAVYLAMHARGEVYRIEAP